MLAVRLWPICDIHRANLNGCSRGIAALAVKLNGSKESISVFASKAFQPNRTMSVRSNSG